MFLVVDYIVSLVCLNGSIYLYLHDSGVFDVNHRICAVVVPLIFDFIFIFSADAPIEMRSNLFDDTLILTESGTPKKYDGGFLVVPAESKIWPLPVFRILAST